MSRERGSNASPKLERSTAMSANFRVMVLARTAAISGAGVIPAISGTATPATGRVPAPGRRNQAHRVMCPAFLRKTFAAALGLLLASAAAPIALADPPGYYFKDFPQFSANASGRAASTATDAQIAAANRKADQALATAQQALREAQLASTSRESALAVGTSTQKRLRPLLQEIPKRATP
jgi:hypothetical protein